MEKLEFPYIALTSLEGSSFAQIDRFETPEDAIAFKKRNNEKGFKIEIYKVEPVKE